MRKRLTAAALCAVVALTAAGCGKKTEETVQANKLVSVAEVQSGTYTDGLSYQGFVKAKDTKNYAFKTGGKIKTIYVTEGQKITAGTKIARLDTTEVDLAAQMSQSNINVADTAINKTATSYDSNIEDLRININTIEETIETLKVSIASYESSFAAAEAGIDALKKNIDAAQSGVDVAKDQMELLKDTYDKTAALYEKGAVSKNDVDTASLQYENAKATYEQAVAQIDSLKAQLQSSEANYEGLKAQYSSAQSQLVSAQNQLASVQNNLAALEKTKANDLASARENKNVASMTRQQYQNSINDASLSADVDGYVMAVNYKEGEIIAAGYPVVIVKSEISVVTVGVSISDRDKITAGMSALINGEIEAAVDSVSEYPDESSRTYSVDIAFNSSAISMGDLVDVFIPLGDKDGSFIPIESVLNVDGVDYVYTLNDDSTVSKTEVELGKIKDNTVQVLNLPDGTKVVTTSVKRLRENEAVTVKE